MAYRCAAINLSASAFDSFLILIIKTRRLVLALLVVIWTNITNMQFYSLQLITCFGVRSGLISEVRSVYFVQFS
jgi:hypothetical protein